MTLDMLFFIAFDLILVMAAISDARSLKISNLYPVALVVLFIPWAILHHGEGPLWQHGLSFLIALGVGVLLFTRSMLGGGDAKLFAATALWFSPRQLLSLVIFITLAGALLVVAVFFRRLFFTSSKGEPVLFLSRKKLLVPYGVAIAAGAIFSYYNFNLHPVMTYNDLLSSLHGA